MNADHLRYFMEVFAATIQPTDLEAHDDQEHSQIFVALQHRDGKRAARLAREHAEKVTREMIKLNTNSK